jgi:ParB family chromosome partitioning protein
MVPPAGQGRGTLSETAARDTVTSETMPADAARAGGPAGNNGNGLGVNGATALASAIAPQGPRQIADGETLMLALDQIDENPYQTRIQLREDQLEELTESIKVSGVLQPIVVRPGKEGRYVLIVGERRCQASRRAGKTEIPAIVRNVSDEHAAEMTIIENLQRADLNPLEQARAFARLSRDFGLTQEQIGQKMGISRESVSNYMRLMRLPQDVQGLLAQNMIDFSMARVLLGLDTPEQISRAAAKAVEKRMSVLELESLVMNIKLPLQKGEQEPRARWVDPNVRAAQQDLERRLGMRVRIRDRRGKGKIVIEYATLEDFDRVLEMLKGK